MTPLPDDLAGLDGRYLPLAQRIVDGLARDERVRAVLLTGSLGSGQADRFSDLDLTAIVRDAAGGEAVARGLPALIGDLVFEAMLPTGSADRVLTSVTSQWLRVDVLVTPASIASARDHQPFVAVFDRDGVSDRLRVAVRPPVDVRATTSEFLRVLGLLDVVIGRGEIAVAARGVTVLRDLLVALFRAENGVGGSGGVKHLSRDLSAEQYGLLLGLPPIAYDEASVIEAQLATARVFLPRARRLLGDAWPDAFARATARHLQRALGVELPELLQGSERDGGSLG